SGAFLADDACTNLASDKTTTMLASEFAAPMYYAGSTAGEQTITALATDQGWKDASFTITIAHGFGEESWETGCVSYLSVYAERAFEAFEGEWTLVEDYFTDSACSSANAVVSIERSGSYEIGDFVKDTNIRKIDLTYEGARATP